MTRAGILSGGALAFIALAIACVAQQQGRPMRVEMTRIVDLPAKTVDAPAPGVASSTTLTPMLRAEFDGTHLVLTGRVPDTALHGSIAENARRLYGADRVTDRLSVAPGIGAAISFGAFPPDLREARRAIALLQDGHLLVSGETDTDLARTRLETTLRAAAAPGWRLDLRLNTGDVDIVDAGIAAPPRLATPTPARLAVPARP